MTIARLILRSLRHYWRTHLCVLVGLIVATAVIAGSLIVGDSMTLTLRRIVLARLGQIDHALIAPHFFRAALADELRATPAILMQGALRNADSDLALPNASICGVDSRFWLLFPNSPDLKLIGDRVAITPSLAADLHLKVGDDLLLNLDRSNSTASPTLFTRRKRQDTLRTLRLQVAAILPDTGPGAFSLDARTTSPRTLFIDREHLATALQKESSANAILTPASDPRDAASLDASLRSSCQLADLGLRLVPSPDQKYTSLESDSLLLTPPQLRAARRIPGAAAVSTYLATRIATPTHSIAYAMIAALESPPAFSLAAGNDNYPTDNQIHLNTWAAEDLNIRIGDDLDLSYLIPNPDGTYSEGTIRLKLTGIVNLTGPAADPHLIPDVPGLTDAQRVDRWNAPFPVDMNRVTPRDEEYWEQHRATPKAFVSRQTLTQIWSTASPSTPDAVTSVRLPLTTTPDALLSHLTPLDAGLTFRPIRRQALDATTGNTDFGVLLLSMSFFLIAAAAALSATLLRLSIDRRSAEIGTLLACGLTRSLATRALWIECLLLSLAGAIVGLPFGILYSLALIQLMHRFSAGPWGNLRPHLHLTGASLLISLLAGLFVGLLCTLWALRTLRRRPVLHLLAGWQSHALRAAARWPRIALALSLALAAVMPILASIGRGGSSPIAFFISGACLLLASLLAAHQLLSLQQKQSIVHKLSLPRLALRSASANRTRSLLAIGLFASATFVLIAVAANHRDLTTLDTASPSSGAGGFALQATTSLPLHYDLSTPAGRHNLGFTPADESLLTNTTILPLLSPPGDDISCLALARPLQPRLLGASPALIARNAFNPTAPWSALLQNSDPAGVIPAFGDADSVQWTLHSAPGQILSIPSSTGSPIKLRIAGLLPGSIFAGQLLIAEPHLRRLHPHLPGPTCFLIATPPDQQSKVADLLRTRLGDFGIELRTTREILAGYLGVQNVYMSMFLALGGLGLLLGAVGMLAVIVRNVFERRRELALMSACGFTRPRLIQLITLEHAALLLVGVLCGSASALLAVAPILSTHSSAIPWTSLILLLLAIATLGLLGCSLAARLSITPAPATTLRQE